MPRSDTAAPTFRIRFAQLCAYLAIVVLALVVAGCATRKPAPVEERSTGTSRPAPTAAAPAPAVPPAPPPEPDTRAQTYTVKRGDTLYKIALDNGLDYRELAAWNSIENVNLIREGQVLRLAAPGEAATTATGVTTTPLRALPPVETGETRTAVPPPVAPAVTPPGTPAITPAPTPGLRNSDNYKTQPKALKEPWSEQALRDVQRSATAPPPVVAPPPAPEPAPPAAVARAEPKPEAKPEPRTDPKSANALPDDATPNWMWPATGKVVTGTSENPNLKGIDIAGKAGQPVVASAAGKVVYAGSGIRGYGKLIIVKHNATWLTAYAHNREILVKEGQQVTKGQSIAEMGNTDSDQVMLHFEIRRHGTPVDPLKFLPPA
jgi:lipoprotein NlpD